MRSNPVTICPTAVASCTPTISRAAHSADGIVLEWDKPAGVTGGFDIYYGNSAGVTAESAVISRTLAESGCASDSSCTHTIPYDSDFTADGTYHFRVEATGATDAADAKFGLSTEANAVGTAPPSGGNGGGNDANPQPAADSGGSGAIALVAIAGGAYLWWKKRQIASGNAAKMALLPDVSFDLDRNDERAFYTRMNWANSSHSNWQLRGNAKIHTKYSGKLLDWHANSHIGYRLNGKFGAFNPYLRGKFVQNDPENAEMLETYTVGVNYSVPNRFSVQFLQPDDEIWRYSLKTQVHLSPRLGLNFARPNSDLPDFSLGLRYQNPQGYSVSVTQPNSEISNYSLGIQWRGASRIRYEFSGNTANNAINKVKLRGSFSF